MSLNPLEKLPKTPLIIKRALLSVSDKTNILPLAESLHAGNVTLLSTGGTYKKIQKAGIPVTEVASLTGYPECLDGRVKTLHPVIHGGILARTSYGPDNAELKQLQIDPIELVVVNLYPFSSITAKHDVAIEEATEYIDIGGQLWYVQQPKTLHMWLYLAIQINIPAFYPNLTLNQPFPFKLD